MSNNFFPTPQHQQAAEQVVDFSSRTTGIDAVLLVNSCARGKATPDSCLEFCDYFLDHVEPYVERGLYFQAFDRLYNALQGFLQGLFISRRKYPIAYNKWIREQVEDILKLPELYRQLPGLLEIPSLESHDLVVKAQRLRKISATYLIE